MSRPVPVLLAAGIACLLLAGSSCSSLKKPTSVPVPVLPERIELRVVHLVNPRLPRMNAEQLQLLLATARAAAMEHFGREVVFSDVKERSINDLFDLDRLSARAKRDLAQAVFDFKSGKGDVARMARTFAQEMEKEKLDLDEVIAFAAPYLESPPRARSYEAIAEALVRTQLSRLAAWKDARSRAGEAVLDDSPYNEFAYWLALLDASYPAEVILTNQLIASAEFADNSVHSAIRGGVTNGLTTSNPVARFLTTSVASTYPMMGDDPTVRQLRGKETYEPEDAARYAGLLLAHELGHQLFHYGHPYAVKACVMNPPPLLHFRAWARGLSAAACRNAHPPAMAPGTAKIPCRFC